jgi:hypothetical protein
LTFRHGLLGHIDVEGLLHFSTLLIFSDGLLVNGFEPHVIANRTLEVIDQLRFLGVPRNALAVVAPEASRYWRACEDAARACSKDLLATFDRSHNDALGTQPDLPQHEQEAIFSFVRVATGRESVSELESIRAAGIERKSSLAIHYMLSCSSSLRAQLAILIGTAPRWDDSQTSRVDTYLRLFLNDALARQLNTLYAPAVARARTLRLHRRLLLDDLLKRLDAAIADLTGGPIGIPSVASALLKRSKGEPRAIVEEALLLRARASPLWSWLDRLTKGVGLDDPEDYLRARQEIEELIRDVIATLRLGDTATMGDAIDVLIIWGIPSVVVSTRTLKSSIRRRFRRKRIAVLTDISKQALFPSPEELYYNRLRVACTRNMNMST